jgi:hypothetical protein
MSTNNDSHLTKADLQAMEQRLEKRFQQLHDYIDERAHDAETRLLRAFGDYQQAQSTRFRHMKADLGNLNTATDERLGSTGNPRHRYR